MTRNNAREIAVHLVFSMEFGSRSGDEVLESELSRERFAALSQETPLYTQLIIWDTGSGIDPEDLPHLFDRFYRGKNAAAQSVGIGLSLARMILTAQNATIQAANRIQGGAQFLIRFYKSAV